MNYILLYTTCFAILISATLVVSSKNALHAVLFLVSSFFFSATTIFLLENEFLALFFLIIYLGAIIVLFLFVVMMLDLKHNRLNIRNVHVPTGVLIGLVSFFYMKFPIEQLLLNTFDYNSVTASNVNVYLNWSSLLDQTTGIIVIAAVLYYDYVAQILIVGVILYIAVIGVVFLTASKYRHSAVKKGQSLTRQLSRNNVL